jgi:hypothetical protein
MSYTCDCGYIIRDAADEERHLKEIHAPDWTPKNKPKLNEKAEVKATATTAEVKSEPKTNTKKK